LVNFRIPVSWLNPPCLKSPPGNQEINPNFKKLGTKEIYPKPLAPLRPIGI